MQGRGLTLTAVVLAILAGLLWWSNREKAKEAAKPPADVNPKILALTGSDIQKLELKKRGFDATVIQKNGSGKWQMTAPETYGVDQEPANPLSPAATTVNSDRLVDEKPTDLKQFGLDHPVGVD